MTTFVLLHGAYQGGWIWNPVAERLRQQGHLVVAPTLDGCAERSTQVRKGITTETHADEVARMLFYYDLKDVVLAGTSTGLVQRYLNWNEKSKGAVILKKICGVLVLLAGLYLIYIAR